MKKTEAILRILFGIGLIFFVVFALMAMVVGLAGNSNLEYVIWMGLAAVVFMGSSYLRGRVNG